MKFQGQQKNAFDIRSLSARIKTLETSSVSATGTAIFVGTATASQDLNAATGTEVSIGWDTSTNNATYIDTHTDGDSTIVMSDDMEIAINASVAIKDAGANNRTMLGLKLVHNNSSDVEQYTYWLDDTYIRDDADTYDSGLMAGSLRLFVSSGDKLIIKSEVLDTSSTTGGPASTTYSKIKIDRITYS